MGRSEWLGRFAFGYESPKAVSLLASTPNPEIALIISKGAAFKVHVKEPFLVHPLPIYPVMSWLTHVDSGLIFLADFTTVFAADFESRSWESARLCLDDLRISEHNGNVIWEGWSDGQVSGTLDFSEIATSPSTPNNGRWPTQ